MQRYRLADLSRPGYLALLLVLVTAVLYLPWLGHTDLVHEETRRAVIARTMMENGDYVVPRLAERIYVSKPPGFNWMIIAASAPGATVTEFTARLPSVVSLALLAVFLVLTVGRRLGPGARWLLGLSVLLTGELMKKAILAEIDVAFTLLVTVSIWGWFELDERGRRGLSLWLPPALVLAAAFLTKREPALVFHYLAIGGYLLFQGRLLELFRPAHLVSAAVALGLIGLWIGTLAQRTGVARLVENLQEEVLTRGLSNSWIDYLTHVAVYPVEILAAALPFSLLLLPLAWPGVRAAVRERYPRMFRFALIALLINLPIYWLRADASVRYFLPMFPTLLVIAAMTFDVFVQRAEPFVRGARRAFSGAGWALLALCVVFAAAGLVLTLPGLFPDVAGPLLPAPLMAALCLLALAAAAYLVLRRRQQAPVIVFAATVGFGLLFRLLHVGYVLPHEAREIARNEDVPAILDGIRARLPAGVQHVQAFGNIPHAIWFYDRAGTVIPPKRYEDSGTLASPYLLVRQADRELLDRLDRPVRRIERIPYEDGDFILAQAGQPRRDDR